MKPTIIGFYGKSDSGKTSLIERLINRLSEESYKVATIKITDKKIGIDSKGKDTWRYSQAGVGVVVFSSPIETDFIVNNKIDTRDIVKKISLFDEYDVILIEGVNNPKIPKIRFGNIKVRENTIHHYKNDFEGVVKLVKNKINEELINDLVEKIELKVNGKTIPLTEFPSTFITNTIIGMLKSLKGIDEIKKVELLLEV